MTGDGSKHHRIHLTRSFITGMIMGAALMLGAYFTYLLVTNDEQETMSRNTALVSNDSIPPLYNLTGFPRILFDSSLQDIDSLYYLNKWNQLIEMSGYREMDSLFIDSVIRKMYFDSIRSVSDASADTIILQNDRLIATKNINVRVQKKLLMNDDTTGADYIYSEAKFVVEFWESPIKFRGLKRTGNYVVIFGLNPKNTTAFLQIDNILYIREKQLWYAVPNSSEFSGLAPVTSGHTHSRIDAAQK